MTPQIFWQTANDSHYFRFVWPYKNGYTVIHQVVDSTVCTLVAGFYRGVGIKVGEKEILRFQFDPPQDATSERNYLYEHQLHETYSVDKDTEYFVFTPLKHIHGGRCLT